MSTIINPAQAWSKVMTGRFKMICAAGLLITFVSGCVSIQKDAGFGDVRKIVAERTGKRVEWHQGGPEDQEVANAVTAMLKKELTADRALQIALLNNRRLQATYEDLGIAQANLVQAGLLRNPVFNAGVSFRSTSPVDLEFSVVQDFLGILYLPARRQVAADQFEAVKFKVAGMVMDLAAEVRAAFYRVQAEQQSADFLRQVVETTGAAYDAAKRLHQAGNVTDVQLASERALYEDARLALAQAELDLAKGHEQLNVLMGIWGADTQWKISPRLPEIPDDTIELSGLESRAIAASLDLAAARKRIESVARILGITDATALVPAFELGAIVIRDDGEWKRGPSATLQIPIFDRGQARLAAAQSELRRAQQIYTAVAIEIRSAVRAAGLAMEVSRTRALHVKNIILPIRTKIVDDTLLQYNAMQVGIFQLLLAQQQQIAAGRQYIETLRDYWLARTQLELILNGRLADTGSSSQLTTTTFGISEFQTGEH